MKKLLCTILSLVFTVVMLAPLSLSVFADAGGPLIVPYDVVVNPGGAVTRDGIFIPEGTVLTISFEYKESGVLWGNIEYNGKYTNIDLADVTNGDTIPEEAGNYYDLSEESRFAVVAENGINVHAGPGYAYNVLFTVPCGERISGNYKMASWLYVRYGDEGGWVMVENYGQPEVVNYREADDPIIVWTIAEAELSDAPWYDGSIIGTVPGDLKLESYLYTPAYCYVTYEGQSGWIESSSATAVNSKHEVIYKATEDGTLYLYELPSDYNDGKSEPVRTLDVKKDEYYLCGFRAWVNDLAWIYMEKDGVSGWTLVLEKECDIADYPYATDIMERTDMTENGYTIRKAAQDADNVEEAKAPEKDVLPPTPDTPDSETKPAGFFSSPTAIIVLCAVSAVVLALVAAVVLVIIKKKKTK